VSGHIERPVARAPARGATVARILIALVSIALGVTALVAGQGSKESDFNRPPADPGAGRLAGMRWTFVRVKYSANTPASHYRIEYWGEPWAIDGPAAEQNLSRRIRTATSIEVADPIVLSLEDGVAHGSCRSIPHFDMLAALEACASFFIRFGGHKQAAGLTMEASRVREFRSVINDRADQLLGPEQLMPRLRIDSDLGFRGITAQVAAGIASLAPFGAGNPKPVFAARRVEVIDGPRKLKERHLKMALRHEGRVFRAVAWRSAEKHDQISENRTAIDVAFSLEQNQYNGETYVELTLADIRPAQP